MYCSACRGRPMHTYAPRRARSAAPLSLVRSVGTVWMASGHGAVPWFADSCLSTKSRSQSSTVPKN